MIPPRYPDTERASRIRKLLALEISRIVEDLDVRRDFLLEMWSVHRKREPFLDTLFSRWTTLGFPLLAELETEEITVVDTFYRELEELRLYFSFTQDMPTTMGDRYDWMLTRLQAYGELALEALGGAPERPLVEFEDAAEDEAARLLEFPAERIAEDRQSVRPMEDAVEEPEEE